MKGLLHTILFFLVSILLWGCPYDSPYGIDAAPQQYIDEALIGKWAAFVQRPSYENDYKESPIKIIFEKRSDMEYDLSITGYIDELRRYRVIDKDTIKGTAYLSVIDSRQFLNTFIKGKMYFAEIKRDNNSISILTLAEHFTSKYIKNSNELRNAISIHYKTRPQPMYDEWFVAKDLQKVN
ncbi:MAG: hypothetical protein IPP72_13170 [Chitinophagaceae bacterium]|nr:hypothetical protein [Chitinophagaceae bacterium]